MLLVGELKKILNNHFLTIQKNKDILGDYITECNERNENNKTQNYLGISIKKKLSVIIENPVIVSAAIGNPLNYTEHSIQKIKLQLLKKPIREAYYLKDRS